MPFVISHLFAICNFSLITTLDVIKKSRILHKSFKEQFQSFILEKRNYNSEV